MSKKDLYGVRQKLTTSGKDYVYYSLKGLDEQGVGDISRLPFSIKVLLEAAVRQYDGHAVTEEHVKQLANWTERKDKTEIPFMPARIVLQDFTGVPVVVDLAALRSAMARAGGDPKRINPLVPVDLVIDHSVMVDAFGTPDALEYNMDVEFERNEERYRFLRWATGLRQFPRRSSGHRDRAPGQPGVPGLGGPDQEVDGETEVYPGLPRRYGLPHDDDQRPRRRRLGRRRYRGRSRHARPTALLRHAGSDRLQADRATGGRRYGDRLGADGNPNAAQKRRRRQIRRILRPRSVQHQPGRPCHGCQHGSGIRRHHGLFPGGRGNAQYLRNTGRDEELVQLVEAYYTAQDMFRTDDTPDPVFTDTVELDL